MKNEKEKKKIILMIILCVILGTGCKFLRDSDTYDCYKDLHYVREGTYCEEVQNLIEIYTRTSHSGQGGATTRLYVKTENIELEVGRQIREKQKYQDFKEKFNEVSQVKLKYLPNTNILLDIEPVTDDKS